MYCKALLITTAIFLQIWVGSPSAMAKLPAPDPDFRAVINPTLKFQKPPGLVWLNENQLEVVSRMRKGSRRYYAIIRGFYYRHGWTLRIGRKKVKLRQSDGQFMRIWRLHKVKTPLYLEVEGPKGETLIYSTTVTIFKRNAPNAEPPPALVQSTPYNFIGKTLYVVDLKAKTCSPVIYNKDNTYIYGTSGGSLKLNGDLLEITGGDLAGKHVISKYKENAGEISMITTLQGATPKQFVQTTQAGCKKLALKIIPHSPGVAATRTPSSFMGEAEWADEEDFEDGDDEEYESDSDDNDEEEWEDDSGV